MVLLLTVTLAFAVLPPSFVVTVTVASPGFNAVTEPSPPTETMSGALDFQVTVLSSASAGLTVAVNLPVSPSVRVRLEGLTETELTRISAGSDLQPGTVMPIMAANTAVMERIVFFIVGLIGIILLEC